LELSGAVLLVAASAAICLGARAADAPARGVDPSCALITRAEAEKVLGETLQEPVVKFAEMCSYMSKGGSTLFGVKLYPKEEKGQFEGELKNAAKMMKAPMKPLPGFGDEAFTIGDYQTAVLLHGKAISLSYATHKLESAKRDALLRIALGRM
jgi:hypothetical protein